MSQFYRLTIPTVPIGLLLLSIFHFTSIYYGSHFKHLIHHSDWNCQNARWRLYLMRVAFASKYLQWNICAGKKRKKKTAESIGYTDEKDERKKERKREKENLFHFKEHVNFGRGAYLIYKHRKNNAYLSKVCESPHSSTFNS